LRLEGLSESLLSMAIPIKDFRGTKAFLNDPIFFRSKEELEKVETSVLEILQSVQEQGDEAILSLTKKFDGIELRELQIKPSHFSTDIDKATQDAFLVAKKNIEEFHKAQIRNDWEIEVSGNRLGVKYVPMDSVCVYAPGGTALYPSSILMGVIPAKIAGVKHIQICTPPQKEGIPPILIWLAQVLEVDTLVTVGGAQGIAGVSYGTQTIRKSDFVVGPGNKYVASAKAILAGQGIIGIESPAGPSEVVVIADKSAKAKWIAADLLSQAEHGRDSRSILATDSSELIQEVQKEIQAALQLPGKRNEMKQFAIDNNSCLCLFQNLDEAIEFSNFLGPEHLEIQTEKPELLFDKISNAGSVFLGEFSPVAMGDYISGTNHVLPTSGYSRIYSGLGVDSFYRRITHQTITKESLSSYYPLVKKMAEIEGLDEEHARSIKVRLD